MIFASTLGVMALAAVASAQTFTNCDPTKKTCPSDPALGMEWNQTFTKTSKFDSDIWNITAGAPLITQTDDGAVFALEHSGDSVTTQTSFYIFWGSIEVEMKAAEGQGIISSIVMLSDDLDEIDWEIMGGNGTNVETNYYGKGGLNQSNAIYYPCTPAPMEAFHTYNISWSKDSVIWRLDGNIIRTVTYAEAEKPGPFFPQTPSYIKLGIWAGGDKSEPEGTRTWAGGLTDYTKGPFYMTVKSIKVQDGSNNATSYVYGDKTGTFDSIKTIQTKKKDGTIQKSPQAEKIAAGPAPTVAERWAKLPAWARYTIVAAPLGILALLSIVGCFCCMKQRKLGRRERAIEDAQWEKNNAEMLSYRKQMASGAFGIAGGQAYQPVANPSRGF